MQELYFRTCVGGDDTARREEGWEYRFHQSMLLKINAKVSLDDVHAAVEAIVGHHSMLRARFRKTEGSWTQRTLAEISGSYSFGRHIIKTNDQVLGIIQQSQASIDIEMGPVFAAELIRTTDDQQMLFLAAHHLVVDLISWRVIVHDLNELLQNGSLYSSRSMPFQKWSELQEEEIKSLEHSFALSFDITPGDFSFWGVNPELNTYGDVTELSFSLAPELSFILQASCNDAFRTDSTDIYLSALLLSFVQTFPERAPPVIWNQEHGREAWSPEVDISEVVGWFTTLCPLWLGTDSSEDLLSVLRRMKDTRRAIPRRGWAYFASRFLGPDNGGFKETDWPFEIMFTYGGSLQQLEAENGILEQLPMPGRSLGSSTSDIGSRVGRVALFEVSTMVDHGVAKVKFLYNRHSQHQDRIRAWVSNFEHLLLEAVGRLRYRAQELTLSDVPLLNVNYSGIAKLNTESLAALNIQSAKEIKDVYPVTPQQQEILISQSKAQESCHLHAIFQFTPSPKKAVDKSRLCMAWELTVAKYPALRTVFISSVSEDGLFDQVVLKKCSPAMLFIDAPPDQDAVAALNRLPAIQCAASEPRHRLSFCGTKRSTFLKLEISQAICDAKSLEKIAADLKAVYACGSVSGGNLELSYPRYIQSLGDARRDSKVDFWRVHLRGCKPCVFPALSTPSEGRTLVTSFKVDVSAADLDAYARRMGVRRSTVLRLAWGLVLKNYTGSKRVVFGYQHTGRDHPQAPLGIDSAVGAFESTVICTLDLSSHRTMEATLQAAEDQLSLYLPHQFTPVSEVTHALGLPGVGLFNTVLSYHDENRGLKSRFNGNQSQNQLDCVLYYKTLDTDVSVSVVAGAGGLDVTLAHRILTRAQAENVANALGCAVKAIIGSANGSVGGVDLFSERDYAQFPAVAIQDESRGQLPVHELVELIVRDDPDAPAVAAWDGRLCYRQLSRLVSRLATYLVELGVKPGLPVPILLGKSRWSSVAILAVLKSGGCFVPLDEDDLYQAYKIIRQLKSKIILTTDVTAGKRLDLKTEDLVVVNELLFSTPLSNDKDLFPVNMGDAACMVFRSPSGKNKEAKGIF
ncbi:AMP-binding protein, partial [Candidatus Bathyarchaeota archaeon]|nr:AMP-binding protein [Candidatus Bathyarchaeota archaeon]